MRPGPVFLSETMGRRQLTLTLGALMLCVFLSALDSSIVANALPRVIADLQGFELYAWVTTGYLLSSTAVVPIGGKLGDRFGRKPMLIGGATFFLAMTLLCGVAQNMPQLIVLRTLQGLGGGVLTATVFAVMGQLLAPAERARISGLITAVFSLAGAVGPVVGGYLTDTFSWRAVFYVNLPFVLLALLILWRFFPQVGYDGRRLPIDVGGAITSVAGIVLLLLALSLGGREYAWDSPIVLSLLGIGVAVLTLFLWLEARAPDPVLPLRLLRNNVVAISSTNSLAQSMAQISLALFVPLYAQAVMGTSATVSGTIMVPMLLGMVASNVAAGLRIAQVGRYKAFAILGFAMGAAGFGMLASLGPQTPFSLLAACLACLGVAIGMIFPTLTLSYQSAVEFRELGVATSLNQFCRSVGSTLGSALFGSILILRFVTGLHASLPDQVNAWLDSPDAAGLRDPQSVLNPSATELLRQQVGQAFPSAPETADVVLAAIRNSLGSALHLVFFIGAGVMLFGFVGSLIWREVPMRRVPARVKDVQDGSGVGVGFSPTNTGTEATVSAPMTEERA
ncbi:MAG: MFS transporter [Chloroflexi bacterium]|nr:MFS transporter [Chloroflexota bacterium]